MKPADVYCDPDRVRRLAARLAATVHWPLRFMEVCGTHTVNLFRFGLRAMLPPRLEVVSGPGCPVCVTAAADIDTCLAAAARPEVEIATFGDLVRVPGSSGTLADRRARGARVTVVHSPAAAVDVARAAPGRLVVFVGIGFETTAPLTAAAITQAAALKLDNFCVLSLHKLMPPIIDRVLGGGHRLDGLLCPGHVAAVVGRCAFAPLAEVYGLPGVIGGFEPVDIMLALVRLAELAGSGAAAVENAYPRAVAENGNPAAQALVKRVFMPADVPWRGFGAVSGSGLVPQDEFARFDARRRLELAPHTVAAAGEPPGCRCGDVVAGRCRPPDCGLFGRRCTPATPVGPCMVSSEGSCAAWYRYGNDGG
jgi:hydrogenase expression/formation protein HypD